ncbi:MAG: hypothetical protein E5W15_00575 [Mesorhizobium sp.]|nr:MAG: hypothetical protein E5W15_00575 [Mesorhizobium sp.]TIW19712.1 MAG: hypothetical protein E5V81_15300 [Mesorhizobium sp.]
MNESLWIGSTKETAAAGASGGTVDRIRMAAMLKEKLGDLKSPRLVKMKPYCSIFDCSLADHIALIESGTPFEREGFSLKKKRAASAGRLQPCNAQGPTSRR